LVRLRVPFFGGAVAGPAGVGRVVLLEDAGDRKERI